MPSAIDLVTIDRAGHLYLRHGQDLVVGSVVLPGLHDAFVWPNHDATAFATIKSGEVAIRALDGTLRWAITLAGASQLAWTARGTPIVLADGWLYALDPADGHVTARRRGWGFGSYPRPITMTSL